MGESGQCQDGSDAAELDDWIERFRGPLVGMLFARGAENPVELAQDVLAEAWLSRDRFLGDRRDERALGAWLRGVAQNLLRAQRRERLRRPRALVEPTQIAASVADAEERDVLLLRAAIARLPVKLRTPLWMHHLEGTPVRTVAHLLGVSPAAVEGRLHRARRELARIVQALSKTEAWS